MTTRTLNNVKPRTLKEVFDTIRTVCTNHLSVAHFDSGTETEIGDNKAYQYPLAYLEEVLSIISDDKGRIHTYDVNLSICDLITNATREQRINIEDSCYQIFLDIYQYLRDKVFGQARVFGFNVSVSPDFTNDKLLRVRGEFKIQVDTPFTPQTPAEDLLKLFPGLQ